MIQERKFRMALLPMCLMLALSGCVTVPPDEHPIGQQKLDKLDLAADIKLAREGWPEAQWWTQYQDPQLNALLKQALTGSPTLDVAASRIRHAHAAMTAIAATEDLDVGLSADANRQRYSANGLFPAPIGGAFINEMTFGVKASYDIDWWGKNRARISAAIGEGNASRAEYAATEQTLAAAVVQQYVQLQQTRAQLDLIGKITQVQHALLTDQQRRIAQGLAAIDTQQQAEANLAELHRQSAELNAQINISREGLRALICADQQALGDLKPVNLPALMPGTPPHLGYDLLARRADLQAAHWRIESSMNRVQAAEAAFYPDVNLSAAVGLDSLTLDHLLEASSRTPFIGSSLTLPLFNSRALKGQLGQARSERDQLIADYNQQVLNAVRDVAQSSAQLRGLDAQLQAHQASRNATAGLLKSTESRLAHGLADQASTLNAELALLKQDQATLQLQTQQRLAEVSLIKALGGGFRSQAAHSAHQSS